MDARHIIAYALLAVMALGAFGFWFALTRERRRNQRAWRSHDRRSRAKRKAARAAAGEA